MFYLRNPDAGSSTNIGLSVFSAVALIPWKLIDICYGSLQSVQWSRAAILIYLDTKLPKRLHGDMNDCSSITIIAGLFLQTAAISELIQSP